MRIAYINKENKVVYIAAFSDDRLIPTHDGTLIYNGETVTQVDGNGIGVDDIWEPTPVEIETTPVDLVTLDESNNADN